MRQAERCNKKKRGSVQETLGRNLRSRADQCADNTRQLECYPDPNLERRGDYRRGEGTANTRLMSSPSGTISFPSLISVGPEKRN